MRGLNIAIAGCGPCGLAAALLLHRGGHNVSIFERFDEPQAIGSGLMLQPTGMSVLSELNLHKRAADAGSRVDRLFGMADGRVVLDVQYEALRNPLAFGVGIHRSSLFAILHQAARAEGIALHTSRAIAGSELSGVRRVLLFEDGRRSAPYDLVVDALGTRTPLAPPIGRELAYGALWASLEWPKDGPFDVRTLEQRYHRASKMVGVLPIGTPPSASRPQAAFFWSLRADQVDAWRSKGLKAWKDNVRALWPECETLLHQIVDPNQLTFARYAHRTLPRPAEPAMVHIGDAWHSASPQLGQGANMALLDAWALAKSLRHANSVATGISNAIAMRRRHVLTYQWLTAMFTPVYQSDGLVLPFLRDRLIGPISKFRPINALQASLVSGLVGSPLNELGLNFTG